MILYVSILIHELAHSTVALRRGLTINSITLHFFGGVSEVNEESNDPKTEAVIAFVGPLSSMIIGGVLLGVDYLFGATLPEFVDAVLLYGGYVNFALALFNLIPAYPMDGGRVFRALIWMHNGDLVKSTKTASSVARLISALFFGFGFLSILSSGFLNGLWLIFIGIFVNSSSQSGLSNTIINQALTGMHVKDMMTKDVRTVEPDVTIQELIDKWFNVYKHQGYPVTKDGELVGVVTNEDVRKVAVDQRSNVTVGAIMRKKDEIVSATPDMNAFDALLKMAKNKVGRLPVVDNGKLVGIVTRSDFNKVIQMKTQFNQ